MPTADDLARAQRLHIRAVQTKPVLIILFLACAGLLLLYLCGLQDVGAYAFGLASGGAFALYMVTIYPARLGRKMFAQQKNLHRNVSFSFGADGVFCMNANGQANTPWGDYLRWREDKHIVLLYLSSALFQFIPKRTLGAQELTAFRNFAAAADVPGAKKAQKKRG